MINKNQISDVISECMANGADFAEIFIENNLQNKILFSDNQIENLSSNNYYGMGIRCFFYLASVLQMA